MKKKQLIELINQNERYKERALDTMCKGRVFVVVNGKLIVSFNRTNLGAESHVKQDKEYYYDFDTKERIQVDSPLQIIRISVSDIVKEE